MEASTPVDPVPAPVPVSPLEHPVVDPVVQTPAAPVDPVAAAVATLDELDGPGANLSTPYDPNADLPPVKFDRYSLERRVLGTVNDEEELTALGARNTLATVSHSLM